MTAVPKNHVLTVKVTPEQYKAITRRASERGVSTGAWMRSILTQAASRQPSEGYLRIREPDGATT